MNDQNNNLLHKRPSKDTILNCFLQCVKYLYPISDNAIIRLSERFAITPEYLAALIEISTI